MTETSLEKVRKVIFSQIDIPEGRPLLDNSDESSFCEDVSFNSASSDNSEVEKSREEIERARRSWESVENQQNQLSKLPIENGVGGTIIDRSTAITYLDSLTYLQEQAKSVVINFNEIPIRFQRKSCICFTPSVPQHIYRAYNDIVKCSKISFIENDTTHHRILNSLHAAITGVTVPPPRIGEIWEDVGFQCSDPTKDLRATGMLGLLLPLGLFSKFKKFGQRVVSVSRSSEQPFPLMLIMISFTDAAIKAGRNSDLYFGADSEREVWDRLLLFFAGLVSTLMTKWVDECLDFQTNYDVFDKVAKQALLSVGDTLAYGIQVREGEN